MANINDRFVADRCFGQPVVYDKLKAKYYCDPKQDHGNVTFYVSGSDSRYRAEKLNRAYLRKQASDRARRLRLKTSP